MEITSQKIRSRPSSARSGYSQQNKPRPTSGKGYRSKPTIIEEDLFGKQQKIQKHPVPKPGDQIFNQGDLQKMKELSKLESEQNLLKKQQIKENKIKKEQITQQKRDYEQRRKTLKRPQSANYQKQIPPNSILGKAQTYFNEQHEEVREMNKIMNDARVKNIRQNQQQQNQQLKTMYDKQEKIQDQMYENKRLLEIRQQEDIILQQKQKNLQDRDKLLKQIEQREDRVIFLNQRIAILEEQEFDKIILNKRLQLLEQQECKKAFDKKKKELDIQLQQVEDNKNHLLYKEVRRQKELKEDKEIIAYQKYKAEQENLQIFELEQIKKQKEMDTQRLREMQERASDKKSEMDQIRAQKAFYERGVQLKEAEQKKIRDHQILVDKMIQSRREQQKLKQGYDKEEKNRDLKYKQQVIDNYHKSIQSDFEKEQQRKIHSKELVLEEKKRILSEQQRYQLIVQHKRNNKINELKAMGIEQDQYRDIFK